MQTDFDRLCTALSRPAAASSLLIQRSLHVRTLRHDFTPAAVLIAIAPDAFGQYGILLTQRAGSLRHHAGQIAFAGGKCDINDADVYATALRETWEEMGIPPEMWHIIATLPECHTPSGFAITPVVAHACRQPALTLNHSEVAHAFWLPLAITLDNTQYGTRATHLNGHVFHTPTLPYQQYDIWGATALMLHHLAERVATP